MPLVMKRVFSIMHLKNIGLFCFESLNAKAIVLVFHFLRSMAILGILRYRVYKSNLYSRIQNSIEIRFTIYSAPLI